MVLLVINQNSEQTGATTSGYDTGRTTPSPIHTDVNMVNLQVFDMNGGHDEFQLVGWPNEYTIKSPCFMVKPP